MELQGGRYSIGILRKERSRYAHSQLSFPALRRQSGQMPSRSAISEFPQRLHLAASKSMSLAGDIVSLSAEKTTAEAIAFFPQTLTHTPQPVHAAVVKSTPWLTPSSPRTYDNALEGQQQTHNGFPAHPSHNPESIVLPKKSKNSEMRGLTSSGSLPAKSAIRRLLRLKPAPIADEGCSTEAHIEKNPPKLAKTLRLDKRPSSSFKGTLLSCRILARPLHASMTPFAFLRFLAVKARDERVSHCSQSPLMSRMSLPYFKARPARKSAVSTQRHGTSGASANMRLQRRRISPPSADAADSVIPVKKGSPAKSASVGQTAAQTMQLSHLPASILRGFKEMAALGHAAAQGGSGYSLKKLHTHCPGLTSTRD